MRRHRRIFDHRPSGHYYQEQSDRQRARAARYKNNTSLTGHVTHGLKSSAERKPPADLWF